MHKNTIKDELKTIIIGLKEIHKLQSWVILVTILDSVLKSIAPFINIFMSAKIIDELVGYKDINKLILFVGITIGLNLIIHLLSTGASHLAKILIIIMGNNQEMELNKKIINMDYEHLENPKTHLLRTKIEEAENQGGGGTYALIINLGKLIKGLVTVPISLLMIMEIFKPNRNIGFLNSNILNIIFIILLAAGTILNMILKGYSDSKFF